MLALWLAEHAEELHGTAEHAAEGAHGTEHATVGVPELPNLIGQLHHVLADKFPGAFDAFDAFLTKVGLFDPLAPGHPFLAFENIIYAALIIIGLSIFFISGYMRLKKSPKEGKLSRRALFIEIMVVFFDDFFGQVLGKKEGRKHLAFVGTLFIYIFACNTLGLIWLGKAPTANLSFNLGMSILVFFYVHYTGISRSALGYLKHYPGELPSVKDLGMGPAGYIVVAFMAVLFTVIHVLEAVIQPVSLALRLFGNVLGKDVLLGVFGGLVTIAIGTFGISFPLHTPFLFLGLLLGAIQALIFSLLSAIYITLWLPHEHEHEHSPAHAEGQH